MAHPFDTSGMLNATMLNPNPAPPVESGIERKPRPIQDPIDQAEILTALNQQETDTGQSIGFYLRKWVDEWIETGRKQDGVEEPGNRHYTDDADEANICTVLRNCSRNFVRTIPSGNSLHLVIWEPLNVWGEPASGKIRAEYLLFLLMSSGLRFQIARCVDCEAYFILPKRKGVWKNGTRCPACRGPKRHSDALRSTTFAREAAQVNLWRAAATPQLRKRISSDPRWADDRKFVSRIVAAVNKVPTGGKLTSKWVVRAKNREGIELAATGKLEA